MKLIIDIEPRYCKDMESDVKALYYEAINRITEAVRNGIPYEERPQGEWIKIGDIGLAYTCNKCGEVNVISTNFCPNCGAYMQKEGDRE